MASSTELVALLGFTEYEWRVYRALLTESPATAYRLGKASGVPLSRVYEAASRLVEKITQRIRQFDQVRGRAVTVYQGDHFRAGTQEWKVEEEAWIRSKPGEDRLRRIASNGEVAVFG